MKFCLILFTLLLFLFAFGQEQKQLNDEIKISGDEIHSNIETHQVKIIGNASFVTDQFQIKNADSIIWGKINNELCIEGKPMITANSIKFSESWNKQTIHYDLEKGSLIMD